MNDIYNFNGVLLCFNNELFHAILNPAVRCPHAIKKFDLYEDILSTNIYKQAITRIYHTASSIKMMKCMKQEKNTHLIKNYFREIMCKYG